MIEYAHLLIILEGATYMTMKFGVYEDAGVQELILWFPDAAKLESLRLLAREFIQS